MERLIAIESKYGGVAVVARAASHNSQSRVTPLSGGKYVGSRLGISSVALSAGVVQTKLNQRVF